ncbi:hypothetical protein ABPG75_000781 [Micractinium tetrahymenae]
MFLYFALLSGCSCCISECFPLPCRLPSQLSRGARAGCVPSTGGSTPNGLHFFSQCMFHCGKAGGAASSATTCVLRQCQVTVTTNSAGSNVFSLFAFPLLEGELATLQPCMGAGCEGAPLQSVDENRTANHGWVAVPTTTTNRRVTRRHLLRQLKKRWAAKMLQHLQQELAGQEEKEAALQLRLAALRAQLRQEAGSKSERGALLEQFFELSENLEAVQEAAKRLRAEQTDAATRAAWEQRRQARQHLQAEHVPAGGGGSSSLAGSGGSGSSVDTADLQRDIFALLVAGPNTAEAEQDAGAGLAQELQGQLTLGGVGQQDVAPASGAAAGLGSTGGRRR